MSYRSFSILVVLCAGAGFGIGLLVFPARSAPARGEAEDGTSSTTSVSPRALELEGVAKPAYPDRLGARPVFTEVTSASGIVFHHENGARGDYLYPELMGSGIAAFDYDDDGDLDLYFVNGNRLRGELDPTITNRLYENLGGFRFRDVTEAAGVGHAGYGHGAAVGDYDGDGDLDLYVSNFGPNVLYRNNGDGTFSDVTAEAGVGDPGWGESSSFLDVDGDGDLDLYVQNYLTYDIDEQTDAWTPVRGRKVRDYPTPLGFRGAADRLYRNDGSGRFTDVTEQSGIGHPNGKGMGVACFDFDRDRDPDIFVANDTAENFLFRNRGDGTFEEIGLIAGVAFSGHGVPEGSMGVDAGDFDGDGLDDLIVPCLHRQVFTLYKNLGDRFVDVSGEVGLAAATARSTGFGANFIDFDHDGDLDIFFSNGAVRASELADPDASYEERYGEPDLLVANDGKGRFIDVSAHAGEHFSRRLMGRGSIAADLDGDGDLDLAISNLKGPAVLLRNDTKGGRAIHIELASSRSDHGYGAVVRVVAGGRTWTRGIHPRVTFLSQIDPRLLHISVGASDRIERIEVAWPSGKRTVVEDVPAEGRVRIAE